MKASKFDLFKIAIALGLAVAFFKTGWEDVKLNSQFKKYGVKTQAKLIGYQYWESPRRWSRGDVPLLSYTALHNAKYIHVAHEYGIANESQKKDLAKQEIYITYLPDMPSTAVVYQWKKPDFQYAGYFWGSIFLIAGLAVIFRQLYLTHHSSGTPNGAP